MPTLKGIHIYNFRNIAEASVEFPSRINCISGDNAQGKTSLLEAIHYLCCCRPSSQLQDRYLYRHGTCEMSVSATAIFPGGLSSKIKLSSVDSTKKLTRDDKTVERLSDFIGTLPVVMVSPADEDLIGDGAAERRHFLDSVLCQMDRSYLHNLQQYRRFLQHRNALLRDPAPDPTMIDVVNMRLAQSAETICKCRREFCEKLQESIKRFYSIISAGAESASVKYRSHVPESGFEEILKDNLTADIQTGYTTAGPHRDDLDFLIDGVLLRRHGSQGQRKSFLVALKMAQYEIMRSSCGECPILLLDDLFDKLDYGRIHNLLKMVMEADFGQIFITDCEGERLRTLTSDLSQGCSFFTTSQGSFTLIQE